MTSIEAYKRFQLKLNKLDSSDNSDITPGEFVLIFNEQQVIWYQDRFKNKSSNFDLSDVQSFIETDTKLVKTNNKNSRYAEYSVPTSYLDYISSYSLCEKSLCTGRVVTHFQVDPRDLNNTLTDDANSPSFEYQETPVTIAKNRIQVYKTDFNVSSTFLTYYRYPVRIDIKGYQHVDGKLSINVDPELSDEYVNEIISLAVTEVQRSTENGDGFTLSNNRP